MTTSRLGPPVPRALTDAARLRHEGRLSEAVALLQTWLGHARETFDTPFRDRVLVGLMLADLYLLVGQRHRAHDLLDGELEFAEQVLRLITESGTPDQVHAASAGCYQLRDRVAQLGLLGRPAPEIEITDWVQGAPTTLAELRGEVVLLEFWAPWCRSCTALLPFFAELHSHYATAGLTILGLTNYSHDAGSDPIERARERAAARQAVTDHGVGYAVGIAPDAGLRHRYGAHGLPTFALVDRSGIVQFASSKPDKTALEKAVVGLL